MCCFGLGFLFCVGFFLCVCFFLQADRPSMEIIIFLNGSIVTTPAECVHSGHCPGTKDSLSYIAGFSTIV